MNPMSLNSLSTLLQDWRQLLINFARSGELSYAAQEALLLQEEAEQLQDLLRDWSESNFSALPPVVLLPAVSMPGAAGAYAISTGTIYLNQDWLANANKQQALAVLTEELGHYLDGLLNNSDTPGDEGRLFAEILLGHWANIDQKQQVQRAETDWGRILIAGHELDVETSTIADAVESQLLTPSQFTSVATLVGDVNQATGGSNPRLFSAFANGLYFVNEVPGLPPQLWRADPETGLVAVVEAAAEEHPIHPEEMVVLGNRLYIRAYESTIGYSLYQIEATDASPITRIAGTEGFDPKWLTALGVHLYFSAFITDATGNWQGHELVQLDPISGMIQSFDLQPGSGSGEPRSLITLNGTLFFIANGAGSGAELWAFNPASDAAPQLLRDIWPGGNSSNISNLTVSGGKLYFTASDGNTDEELWVSDGTAAGTTRVADINQTTYGSNPQPVISSGGKLYFTAFTDANGWELYRLDPATGSLQQLEISGGHGSSEPGGNGGGFADLNGTLYFSAYDDSNGWQLWRVHPDGLPEILRLGTYQSNPQSLMVVGDTLYFSAEGQSSRGVDLSRSIELNNQGVNLSFDFLRFDSWDGDQLQVFIDGHLVFQQPFYDWQTTEVQSGVSGGVAWSIIPSAQAGEDLNGNSPWWYSNDQVFQVTLTIPAGRQTIRLGIGSTLDEAIENESYGIRNLEIRLADDPSQLLLSEADNLAERWDGGRSAISTILGNFIGPYGSETFIGRELWRIDNSTGETVPIDINPGPGGSDPRELFAIGEKLFFTAYMPGVGYELWTLDPTDNYPYLVADINPGEASSRGDRSYSWWHGWNWRPYGDNSVEAAAGRIYFSALGPEGLELFVVAPSTAGAQLLDLNVGAGGSEPQLLTVVGERLFFKAFDGSKWALYGTNVESGLPYELPIPGLTNAESVQNLIAVGERLYLVSDAYSDDGTVYGALYSIDTRTDEASRIEDISQATGLTVVSGMLFFRAYSSITGRHNEWFALKPEDPSQAANLIDFQSGWWGSSIESLASSSDAIYAVAYGRPLEDLSRSFDLADEAVSISFEFLRLDTWDGEYLRLFLDGQEVFSEPFAYYDINDQSRTGEAAGYSWSITPISSIDHFAGNENYLDQLFRITVTIPAGRRSIRLSLGSTLDEDLNNEGYGIRNLEIRSAVDPSQLLLADPGHDPSLWSGGRSASSATLGAFLGVFGGTKEWNLWRLDPDELTRTMRPLLPASAPNKQSVSNLFSVGSTLYFSYDDGVNGRELWQSDGTAAGTRLAADVNGRSLPAHPRDLTDVNGRLFFTADDGVNGRGLYTLDTATGLVQRLAVPGLTAGKDAYIDSLIAAGEKLFFRSYNSNDAGIYQPLYNLDPTSLAISHVADVSHVNSLQYLQGQLFFSAYSSTYQEGYELFRIADGSTEPELIDVNPGSGPSHVQDLVQAGGVIFFTAVRDGLGRELFRLDESHNAVQVRDIRPGDRGSDPHLLFVVDNTLYFVADDGFHGRELWQSDGTEAGTRLARDINTLTLDASPEELVDVNGILYFIATDGSLGRGLYRIDPASGRPQRLAIPGLTRGNEATIDGLINASGRLYFRSYSSSDEGTYQPLFTLDPATGSISQVAGVSHVNGLKHLNRQLFFTAYSGTFQEGYELFRIADGSLQPQLIDINPGAGSSNPDQLTLHDSTTYLAARRDDIGRELFRLGPDFVPVALGNLSRGDANPFQLTSAGDSLFFVGYGAIGPAGPGQDASQSFTLDGSATTISFDLLRLDSWGGETFTVYLDDEPLFSQRFYYWQNTDASTGDTNGINWSLTPTTDWTELYGSNWGGYESYDQRFRVSLQLPAGRMAVKLGFGSGLDEAADHESYAIDNLEIRSADNSLIAVNTFDTADGWAGGAVSELAGAGSVLGPYAAQGENWQLWKVNPSNQQLESVAISGLDVNSPYSNSEIVALGSRVFFRYQTWPWWSGSSLLYSIHAETGVAHQVDGLRDVTDIRVVGDSLYAAGTYDDQGGQLVRIDADAMVSVMDLRGGTSPAWLTAVGNSLYFSAYAYGVDGEWLGRELWRIDPVSGSPRVIDLWPGSNGSDPRDLVDVQGTLYFIARREGNGIGLGEELYRIDPITDQVELLGDIYNGSGSSNPTNLTLSNGNLYFAATDILHGRELWRVQLNAAGSGVELSRSLAEDNTLVFTADDFAIPFAAGGGGTLQDIQILSLPINGQLQLNGVASTINQIIPISSIDQLSFVPDADYNGSAGFSWTGSNGSGFASLPSLVTLTVTPVADAPRLQQPLLDRSIYSNRTDGYTFDVTTFRDPDPGQALTYSATLADGTPLPEWIRLNGRSFSFNPLPDAVGQYSIRVVATDPDGLSSLAAADPGSIFNLQVINAEPQSLQLSDSRSDENSANGTVVGAFTVIDLNSNDRHTLTLLDSADGCFGLSGSPATGYNLVVADGSRLDFEAATSHQIKVLVTDETGLTLEQTFTIELNNLPDSAAGNLTFSSANFSIGEDGQAVLPVTINRVGGVEGSISVTLLLTPGTATYPADYALQQLTVVFANGETRRTVSIPIVNDTLIEGDENLTLTLTNPTGGAGLTGQLSATLTIVDNDFPPIPAPTVTGQLTNSSTPLITGTAVVASANQFSVSLNDKTYILGSSPELSLTGGDWSLAIPPAHALADGLYNVVATVKDPSGSAVSDSTTAELRIDTTPPVTTVSSGPSPLYFPLLQGHSEPDAHLLISSGGASWNLTVPGDGHWQLDTSTTPASGSFAPNRDGANPLTITATDAAGNTSLFSGQLVIRYPYPDLQITAASLSGGDSLSTTTLAYTVRNNAPDGPLQPAHIATGSWIDRFYLSPDAVYGNGNDLAIGPAQAINGPLGAGESYSRSVDIQLPDYPGSYYLIAIADADLSVAEGLSEANNVFISAAPITVAPIYNATVSAAVENLNAGQALTLNGQLVLSASGAGMAGRAVVVTFSNQTTGLAFTRSITSGSDGNFSLSFTPTAEQAGAYSISARYAGNLQEDLLPDGTLLAEDTFRAQGLTFAPGMPIYASLAEGATFNGSITIRNTGADPLTTIGFSVSGAPDHWSISLGNLPATLAAGDSSTISYSVTAPDASVLFDDFELIATAAAAGLPALTARQPLEIAIVPNRPLLVVDEARRSAAMLLGQRTFHDVTLTNNGNASTGALSVVLPGGAPWLSLYSSPTLAPLAPGASTNILLALDPAPDLPLAQYQVSVGFLDQANPSDSLVVPFSFLATSSATGSVDVAVYNEFSSAPPYPTVGNVSVRLYDRISDALIESLTDEDGRFSFQDLPVGLYALEVQAPGHASGWQSFTVEPGDQRQVDVFLPSELVRYSWVVVPTTVQDQYLITLEATFQTEVPLPVVTITPSPVDLRSLDRLNQTLLVPLTITNHGLVAARDLSFASPYHPNYSISLLDNIAGLTLEAQDSLLVNLRIERVADDPNAPTSIGLGNLFWEYGTFLPNQTAPITVEQATPLPFLIDGPGPLPVLPIGWGGGWGGGGGGGGGFPGIPEVFTVAPSPVPVPYATARVKIQINQDAVLSRDAFEGTFVLENLDPSIDLSAIAIDLEIYDERGNLVTDRFAITTPTLSGFAGALDGSGSLAANSSGTATYTILAKDTAAAIEPTRYSIGGRVRYERADGAVDFNLAPAAITVLPQPVLAFDYFLQRDVFSDDPFTPGVEPSQPFVLGLLAHNRGYGAANNLTITSAQPEIIENELGLKIAFELLGAAVNGNEVLPSLSVNLGDLPALSTSEAYWLMTSTLQGRFVDYKASFEYVNALGLKDVPGLSQLTEVNIHELTRRVRDHRSGADTGFDYLVNSNPPGVGEENASGDLIPDILYLSNGSTEPVSALLPGHPAVAISAITASGSASLSVQAPSGWTYLRVLDPSAGSRPISAIRRADGSLVSADNYWITDRTFPENGRPTYESSLHILDYSAAGGAAMYTLEFGPDDLSPIWTLKEGDKLDLDLTQSHDAAILLYLTNLFSSEFKFNFVRSSNLSVETGQDESGSFRKVRGKWEAIPLAGLSWVLDNVLEFEFSGDNYIKITTDESGNERLDIVGRITLSNSVPLFWTKTKADDISFFIDTLENEWKADLRLKNVLYSSADLIGGIGFLKGNINYVSFGVRDLNSYLGLKLYLQDFTLALDNLASLDPKDPFAVEAEFGIGLTYLPEIKLDLPFWWLLDEPSLSLARIDSLVTIIPIDNTISGVADISILGGAIKSKVDLDWKLNESFEFSSSEWSFFDGIINYSAPTLIPTKLSIDLASSSFYAHWKAGSTISWPSWLDSKPAWLPGKSMPFSGSYAQAILSYTHDDTLANDYIWLGNSKEFGDGSFANYFQIGVRIGFDGSFSFTSSPELSVSTEPQALRSLAFSSASLETTHVHSRKTVVVDPQTEWVIFQVVWEGSDTSPQFELIDPTGLRFSEETWDSTRFQIVDFLTSSTTKAVAVLAPEPGTWQLLANSSVDIGTTEIYAFRNSLTPSIEINSVISDCDLGLHTISYSLFPDVPGAQASLFYSPSLDADIDGRIIALDLIGNDGLAGFTWDTSGIAPGSYYIYATAFDGLNISEKSFWNSPIEITKSSDLSISASAVDRAARPGEVYEFIVEVANRGPSRAGSVELALSIPLPSSLIEASVPLASTGGLTFTIGALESGATVSASFKVQAPIASWEGDSFDLRFDVSSKTYESDISNNAAIVKLPFVKEVVPFVVAVEDDQGGVKGVVLESSMTDDTTPLISGTLSAPLYGTEQVVVFSRDEFLGIAEVDGSSWRLAPKLSLGETYRIFARVIGVDGFLGPSSASFAFAVNNTNDGAAAFTISGTPSVGETLTATVSTSDPDGDGSIVYQWQISSEGTDWSGVGTNSASYSITPADEGKQLRLLASYADGEGFTESVITDIGLIPVQNQPPTALALSNTVASLAENTSTTSPIKVADIVITDDALGTNVITLAGADAASFEVIGTELFLKAGTALEFESKADYAVTVSVSDPSLTGSTPVSAAFNLAVSDANEPPTALALTNTIASLAENTSTTSRIKVADIVVTDDALGSNLISLAGADAASFEVDGTELFLKVGTALDIETKAAYAVTVSASDPALPGSMPVSAAFNLAVSDVNEPPTTLSLSASSFDENIPPGSTVATLATVDPDADSTFTYSLVSGSGDRDNSAFSIDGNRLLIQLLPNFESKSSYNIRIRSTDQGGLWLERAVSLAVNNLNDEQATVTISGLSDNVGTIKGPVADGGITNDTTPTLSGTLLAALGRSETLRVYRDGEVAGNARVNASNLTWSYTPATPLIANGAYVFTAAVVDGAGNVGPLSDPWSMQLEAPISTAERDDLTGTTAADTFLLPQLSWSLVGAVDDPTYDTVTGFQSRDRLQLLGSTFNTRLTSSAGVATSLAPADIANTLTPTWAANSARAFTATGLSGTFVALNDAQAGYQAESDAILFLQGYNVSAVNVIILV